MWLAIRSSKTSGIAGMLAKTTLKSNDSIIRSQIKSNLYKKIIFQKMSW
jgi:hypothetical protein